MHLITGMFIVVFLGVACGRSPQERPPIRAAPAAVSWREAYDLDGDGRNDRVISELTGGAHCCYHIGAVLSSTGKTVILPFDMDGGYPRGLDLSQPDRFTIRSRPGGLPEIVYQIGIYNGELQSLDPSWTERWQIRSHRVVLCFAGGTPQVHDEDPALPPCKR